MNGRKKVTVVGAGNVGATCAQEVARRDYADVVLVDVKPSLAAGKALDINQAGSVLGYEPRVVGVDGNGYNATSGSDVVVITAGLPRKPGMSRDDLVKTNEEIVAEVTRQVARRSRKAVLVIVSNPLDAMCHGSTRCSRTAATSRSRPSSRRRWSRSRSRSCVSGSQAAAGPSSARC